MRLNKSDYDYAKQTLKRYDYNKLKENKEYQAVERAKLLLGIESRYIFEEEFRKKRNKWDVMEELSISEPTYKRRRKELIYTIHSELKLIQNWAKIELILYKNRVIMIMEEIPLHSHNGSFSPYARAVIYSSFFYLCARHK